MNVICTHICNEYYIGTAVDLQDIIKQWQIFYLLPMCTTDAGLSIASLSVRVMSDLVILFEVLVRTYALAVDRAVDN